MQVWLSFAECNFYRAGFVAGSNRRQASGHHWKVPEEGLGMYRRLFNLRQLYEERRLDNLRYFEEVNR